MILHQESTAQDKASAFEFLFSYNWLIVNLFSSTASIALVKAVNAPGGID